ncbi:ABC transporter ATP-binding protein [Spirochaeta africana]|uniref:ABC-type multidrug transport system, ATPase and permease component n=1 Tax=Spirochaeta africana (strain ATCC 700263 / DSM 8902 / Z-7692) TaxID=889378 RepID=H9UKF4_SPIAZ|nr:ABC transporter ATP-binding protein [Spirochaeta africana]AFG37997.1 ABC-type multidrug transport system, ATPase and permease component [Spirochaeta africana DSM 8902]
MKAYLTLLPYFRQYLRWYLVGSVALLVASGSQLLIPLFIRDAVDIIAFGDFTLQQLLRPLLFMMLAATAIVIGRLGWRFCIHGASRRIEGQLRSRLFSHLLRLSPAYYNRTSIGDLMARATNDMNAIRMASGMALVAAVDGVFMTIAILAILFAQAPQLAAYTIIPFPLITLFILSLGKIVGKLFRGVQDSFSQVSTQAQEVLSGISVVKSYAKQDRFIQRFADANWDYQQRNMRLVRIWGLFMPIITFLSGTTTLLLLRFGGEQVIIGSISPGTFVATLSYLQLLVWPMMGAGWLVNLIQRGAASLQRINEVLDTEPEICQPDNPRPLDTIEQIEIRNLNFHYSPQEPPVLQDISLTIPHGKTIGLLGRTGSGKSSLIQLLCRLYNPPPGTVLINGSDILQLDLQQLRARIGVVSQNSFLFSATLRDNIAFGVPGAPHPLLERVAGVATIDRDMQDFPRGWETPIGERGITLSGGQKQRTTIARALAVQPDVLIFDDALSAVDTETEENILERLFAERRGRTNIIISHRVSTLSHTDYIYVLDHGRILQHGTHRSLSRSAGLYRDIVLMQQLDRAHEDHPHHEDQQ